MAISDLQQPPILVYRVDFTPSSPVTPAVADIDRFNQDLFVATSGGSDENAQPIPGSLAEAIFQTPSILQPDGLHLTITRSPGAANRTDLLCGLRIPRNILKFRISADFVLDSSTNEPGPENPGDTWATSVFIRNGEQTSTLGATIVGATQQVVTQAGGDVQIRLGAANAKILSPSPMNTQVPRAAVYDLSHQAFRLAAYVDCVSGTGQSQLTTASGYHWENAWTHPFRSVGELHLEDTLYGGFGVAIAATSGPGTARVIVQKFSVLEWPFQPPVGPTLGGIKQG